MNRANSVLERCGSTNDLARELGEQGAPHGTWVSARIQDQGRGRLGRQWQSLDGNLFLSLIARLEDKSRWTWVPLVTAVAVARLLESRHPSLEVRIKWPNDLWIGGAKLGGILCEAVGTRSGSFIIIGLGLNCLHAPEGLDQKTVSLSEALGKPLSADEIRAEVVSSILGTLAELAERGSSALLLEFEKKAAFQRDSEIEWVSTGTSGQAVRHGKVRGLGAAGELLVTLPEGTEFKLYAEDVKVRSPR